MIFECNETFFLGVVGWWKTCLDLELFGDKTMKNMRKMRMECKMLNLILYEMIIIEDFWIFVLEIWDIHIKMLNSILEWMIFF